MANSCLEKTTAAGDYDGGSGGGGTLLCGVKCVRQSPRKSLYQMFK